MKDIVVGDEVHVWDTQSNTLVVKPVLWFIRKTAGGYTMLNIKLENGSSIGLTPQHYVFSSMLDKSIRAEDLKVGDYLPTINGKSKIIDITSTTDSVAYLPFTGSSELVCNGIVSNNYCSGCSSSQTLCNKCESNVTVVKDTCNMYDEIYKVYLKNPTLKNLKHVAMVYGSTEEYHSILYSKNPKLAFTKMINATTQEQLDRSIAILQRMDEITIDFINDINV